MRIIQQATLATALLAAAGVAQAQTTIITRERPVETETVVTERPVELTPVQRQTIYRTIARGPVEAAPPPTVEYRVGARVPESVQLYSVPESVAVEVPAIKRYKYMRVNNRVVLIDPRTSEVVDEIVLLTRSEAVKNGVSVRTQFAGNLPTIQGTQVQLQQVVLNLIINAIEAMSEVDDGVRELQISTERDASDGVLVTVRDSGLGLAPDALARVFEAFYTTKPAGLGLGLSICRSIIEAHGGQLWATATATATRGATFQFTLPSGEGS